MGALTRERLDDGIEVLRLDRPEVRNAMDTALLEELDGALRELAGDAGLRALVVSTTSERALCAGADVSEELDRAGGVARMERFTALYAAVEAFPAPTIAVCVGNVVGAGAELAVGCDLRVGGDNLKLVFPGARLGVPVGPARLVPLIGLSKARELIFTGRVVGPDEADALGLLARRAPAAGAEAAAIALARELAVHPPEGLRHLKQLFREYEDTKERVSRENAEIVEFQRVGGGLPYGGVRRG
ncbi:MAG TPA: enoyl-CoA hydratase/isomerase family protein [Baekduia sp.]|uniref:enoyl-CoA hydratase/isomerase family protein n=1 Tax=Baekduia sp. TaxID=2600305 RepID=UPI002BCC92F5|nr:enoyl-CoA hydratase/isomerase family protein [Baekduia sp.]HMJ33638.1 enoyl-CoA hydratase/isomerase family protein [Baekduia sp.]